MLAVAANLGKGGQKGPSPGQGGQLGWGNGWGCPGTGMVPRGCQGDAVGGPTSAPELILFQREDFINTSKYKP